MTTRKKKSFLATYAHTRIERIVLGISIAELAIFLFGLVWALLTYNSLAVALTAFIWFADIPLIILACFFSLLSLRSIDSATNMYRVFFCLNWVISLGLVMNITD